MRKKQAEMVPPKDEDAALMKIMSAKTRRLDMLKLRLKMVLGLRV